MIKRTAPSIPDAPAPSSNASPSGASEFPEREFYTQKLKQALGPRIDSLTQPAILHAIETHFRQHPEHAHDSRAIVAVACQAKKAQLAEGRAKALRVLSVPVHRNRARDRLPCLTLCLRLPHEFQDPQSGWYRYFHQLIAGTERQRLIHETFRPMHSTIGFWTGRVGHLETMATVFLRRAAILLNAAFSFTPASLTKS